MPEREYINERQKIIQRIEDTEKRISILQTADNNEAYSEEYEAKASYFIMIEKILGGEYIGQIYTNDRAYCPKKLIQANYQKHLHYRQ